MKSKKKIKIYQACGILIAILILVSIAPKFLENHGIVASAAQETLPGIEVLRDKYISTDESYQILELVPNYSQEDMIPSAELGFYIGGQEPLYSLYDEETKTFISWKEALSKIYDETTRESYMVEIVNEAKEALRKIVDSDKTITDVSVPFSVDDYLEVEPTDAYDGMITIKGYIARGIFTYQGEGSSSANWNVVFKPIENTNVSIESEVNKGITTAYYKAEEGNLLTYGELQILATNTNTMDQPMYMLAENGYLQYVNTVSKIWEEIKESVNIGDVSNGDISGGDVSSGDVSDGDIKYELTDNSMYFGAIFSLINNVEGNQAKPGDKIYVVNEKETSYIEKNGNYLLTETLEGFEAGDKFEVKEQIIYYTGGIKNSEVFKRQVLGLDSIEEIENFHITINVVTSEFFNSFLEENREEALNVLEQINFIYMHGNFSKNSDLSRNAVEELALYTYREQVPFMMDISSIMMSSGENYFNVSAEMESANLTKLFYFLTHPYKVSFIDSGGKGFQDDSIFKLDLNSLKESGGFNVDLDFDLNYVRENILIFDNIKTPLIKTDGLMSNKSYSEEKIAGGFYNVLEEIELENMYRESDISFQGGFLSTDIYEKDILRYIINYANRRVSVNKETLTVLAIEPATNITNLTTEMVADWSGIDQEKITIVCMAMNEFIGSIEDLNKEYDIIYFGAQTTNLNVSSGTTIYNDPRMKGLLYSHVGDIVTGKYEVSGLLDTDYINNDRNNELTKADATYRYSGNDLTLEKYNHLLDYLDTYYPIVFHSDLTTKKEENKLIANESRVDNSSYLYEFINVAIGRKNVFSIDQLPTESTASKNTLFEFYVNRPKLTLYATNYPDLIMTTEKYANKYNNTGNITLIKKDATTNAFYLQYQFVIDNAGAVSYKDAYTCKLYIDSNADGKFSTLNEELTSLIITDENNNRVSYNNLRAGVEYTVSREIPDIYQGAITWKLEISQSSNNFVRTNSIGYTKLATESEAPVIKILQIYYHTNSNSVVNLQSLIGTWDGVNKKYINSNNSNFNKFANEILGDYILDITAISRADYENRRALSVASTNYLDLSSYDMLILGFSDAQDSVDWGEEAVIAPTNSIKAFIESGKSVLFAHDMSSLSNVSTQSKPSEWTPSLDWYWNYNINQYIREMVGLDTYGITTSNNDENSSYSILKKGVPLKRDENGILSISEPKKDKNGRYDYNVKDVAYTPGSNRETTVSETQGYVAYIFLRRGNFATNKYHYRSLFSANFNTADTTNVVKINEGQITNYPFKIADNITIATTHNQYYTLDMNEDGDGDGQTDIVVWYNLTGKTSSVENISKNLDRLYNVAVNDVKNNYYIYSKGNVMYTGMGHRVGVSDDEAKLFLNTMIAAYQTGRKNPEITVLNDAGLETDTIYTYFDSVVDHKNLMSGESTRIYFEIADLNVNQGEKKIEVCFYIGENNITEVVELFAVTGLDESGVKVNDLSALDSNQLLYYVEIPNEQFESKTVFSNNIVIGAKTTMTKTTTSGTKITTETSWGYKTVRQVFVELLDLD